jgi:hypothetical protein
VVSALGKHTPLNDIKDVAAAAVAEVLEQWAREHVIVNSPATPTINDHEGKKYLREIRSTLNFDYKISVDVYQVCDAFGVDDHSGAIHHAIKKLLCCGTRGKGDRLADLKGAMAAISRAVELEEGRVKAAKGV